MGAIMGVIMGDLQNCPSLAHFFHHGDLAQGEIIDLNVMTRRRRLSHRLQQIRQPASCALGGNHTAVVLSLNGSTTLVSEQDVATLDHAEAAILVGTQEGSIRIEPIGSSDCYLVLLHNQVT
jgi:uncharacterized protein